MERFWAPRNDPDYELLRTAAKEGNEEVIRSLIRKDIRLDALFSYEDRQEGTTILHMAASSGHTNIVTLLLAHGVDVDIEDVDRFASVTAIYDAAYAVQPSSIKVLLEAGAHTNSVGPNEESVLSAVLLGSHHNVKAEIEALGLLLDSGMDVNMRVEGFGTTVLELAVDHNKKEAIHFLHDRGASLDGVLLRAVQHNDPSLFHMLLDAGATEVGHQAITQASSRGRFEIVKILLTDKAAAKLAADCNDPLSAAARNGHVGILKLLLDHDFAINRTDQYGLTPLHEVTRATWPRMQAMQFLLDHGADPLARTVEVPGMYCCKDMNVLQVSAEKCHIEMIQKIIEIEPATLNLAGEEGHREGDSAFLTFARELWRGYTLADHLSSEGALPTRVQALRILIDAGANLNDQDCIGRTALHIIAADAHVESISLKMRAIQFLLDRGIDTSIRDNDDCTPYELARHQEIANMLMAS